MTGPGRTPLSVWLDQPHGAFGMAVRAAIDPLWHVESEAPELAAAFRRHIDEMKYADDPDHLGHFSVTRFVVDLDTDPETDRAIVDFQTVTLPSPLREHFQEVARSHLRGRAGGRADRLLELIRQTEFAP